MANNIENKRNLNNVKNAGIVLEDSELANVSGGSGDDLIESKAGLIFKNDGGATGGGMGQMPK